MFFLSRRLSHHRQIVERPGTVVQDRTVYEDAEIFARNLHLQGHMSERDWQSYWDLYQTVITILPPPDLVIYLKASVPELADQLQAVYDELAKVGRGDTRVGLVVLPAEVLALA